MLRLTFILSLVLYVASYFFDAWSYVEDILAWFLFGESYVEDILAVVAWSYVEDVLAVVASELSVTGTRVLSLTKQKSH